MMKRYIALIFIVMFCSQTACYPERKLPVESVTPTNIFPTATTTHVVISATPLPMVESSPTFVSTILPQTVTDIPEETQETGMPITQVITIAILYDNQVSDQRLGSAWGFSALIVDGNNTLLFDTGGDGQLLLQNMQILGIDSLNIKSVVLSHAHEDHTGGLIALLEAGVKPQVYLLPSFPMSFKKQVEQYTNFIEVSPGQQLAEGIWTTGEIGGSIPEQALVIQTTRGLVVITGCAHPGIILLLEKVNDLYDQPVYLVMGGFHLDDKSESEITGIVEDFHRLGVEQVAPCHCTGEFAITKFAEEYGNDFIQVGVGAIFHLEAFESN
jgi:7,8-dihydropterin-6-yl-methyl-4-(beta-D-ribofuranosyl)aminobenzene 5'-phosphate synthase